ncbi:MAG: type II secretion system protein [Candidatus Omnitrophica bacterium]|nr:type II secretion system protein [Candidatus Omnitrophota bacterium]MDD5488959.1 type II secretion system protein [Candidatus Omnitrophota bacterium]
MKILCEKKGFSFIEMMFVTVLSAVVISVIVSAWVYSYRSWTSESERTEMRFSLATALETIRSDLRLSSLTHIYFYPSGASDYTAISIPIAIPDANGFFTIDPDTGITWDRTVIYHLYNETDGTKTLRRTVLSPRNNSLTETQRYAELTTVTTSGEVTTGGTTDRDFLHNVDQFNVSSLASVIDFYQDSSTPVRSARTLFGWANITPGTHAIRFEVTGKNPLSSGYDIGIDNIMIEPSGSKRELEYYSSSYADAGSFSSEGGTVANVTDPIWDNNNYLEFQTGDYGENVYIEVEDHYDLWRDSSFDNAVLDHTKLDGTDPHIALDMPDLDEPGLILWKALSQAGESSGTDVSMPGPGAPMMFRVLIPGGSTSSEADLIRVKFKAPANDPLTITRAYITLADAATGGFEGLANQDPAIVPAVPDYHRHQEIFFSSVSGGGTDSVIIPAGSEVWSEWIAFPIRDDRDYFISVYVSSSPGSECVAWEYSDASARSLSVGSIPCVADSLTDTFTTTAEHGMPDGTKVGVGGGGVPGGLTSCPAPVNLTGIPGLGSYTTYYIVNAGLDTFQLAYVPAGAPVDLTSDGTNVEVYPFEEHDDMYIVDSLDSSMTKGSVTSAIFDTALSSPVYDSIAWDEYKPSSTEITVKARTSSSSDMTDASDWDSVSASSIDGAGRYLQFYAELADTPNWSASGSSLSYASYIAAQILSPSTPYLFPSYSGEYYLPDLSVPWIDNVETRWEGETHLCSITGYIARKDDYGQAKILVDGAELLKVLSIYLKVSRDIDGRDVSEEGYLEVEPRNTGK